MVTPFETAGVPGSEGSSSDTFQLLLRRIPDCLTLQFLLFISCLTQREGCLMVTFLSPARNFYRQTLFHMYILKSF